MGVMFFINRKRGIPHERTFLPNLAKLTNQRAEKFGITACHFGMWEKNVASMPGYSRTYVIGKKGGAARLRSLEKGVGMIKSVLHDK